MLLVVGLGNPGAKYAKHRHNVGFMVLERFAQQHAAPAARERFSGLLTKAQVGGHDVLLLEPQTYMNLSGRSVQQTLHFFKLGLPDLVVVHDELDLRFGAVRIKIGGGSAGHRGIALDHGMLWRTADFAGCASVSAGRSRAASKATC